MGCESSIGPGSLGGQLIGAGFSWIIGCTTSLRSRGALAMAFEFMGAESANADAALLVATPETVKPPICIGGTATVNSQSLDVNGLSLNLSNQLGRHENLNYAGGIRSYRITSRNWTGSLALDRVNYGTADFIDLLRDSTTFPVDLAIGETSSNEYRFFAPEVNLTEHNRGDREGIALSEMPCLFTSPHEEGEFCIIQY